MFKCNVCNGTTRVVDVRRFKRRRECLDCGERFSTVELRDEQLYAYNEMIKLGKSLSLNQITQMVRLAQVADEC